MVSTTALASLLSDNMLLISLLANALFSSSLANVLPANIYVSSYHPGVMLTDLWSLRSTGKEADVYDSRLISAEDCMRYCTCCCVKHPCVSGMGLATLAQPRCCIDYCISLREVDECCFLKSDFLKILSLMTIGTSGAYFQQCGCCCLCPVRPSYALYKEDNQKKLMENSLSYIKRKDEELGHLLQMQLIEAFGEKGYSEYKKRVFVSPALPGSELLSIAPYCICISCLC